MLTDNLLTPEAIANPYPIYDRLRAERPVWWDPYQQGWMLTRYSDVSRALRDPRLTTAHSVRQSADVAPQLRESLEQMTRCFGTWLVFTDPPENSRMHNLVKRGFAKDAIVHSESRIEALAQECLQGIPNGSSFDVVAGFAQPIATISLALMLGVERKDVGRLQQWTENLVTFFGTHVPTKTAIDSFHQMLSYLKASASHLRSCPGEELIDLLLRAESGGVVRDEEELLFNWIFLLLVGHTTTTTLISAGILALLMNPDQMETLRANADLATVAVEEFLRYESPIQVVSRTALQDVDYGGKFIRKGEPLLLSLGAANRDPDEFEDPNRLHVGRVANNHLAFIQGPHVCVGAPLARLEGRIAIKAILQRFSKLELAGPIAWKPNLALRRLEHLHVRVVG
jgi:hypothetical protein